MKHIYKDKEFDTREELFDFLRENKSLLKKEKRASIKYADAISCSMVTVADDGTVSKAEALAEEPTGTLAVSVVINTTNLLDSHGDVHIPGIWKKSLKENKSILFLQEHVMTFDHIISDKIAASAQTIDWKELGYKFPGSTQALVFAAQIEKQRNPFMYDQYAKGYVRNHSVGMQYINYDLAMNSDSKYDVDEKARWDKYIDQVANREAAEDKGWFWVVTEAKIIEGSAVPLGSNYATPTLSVTEPGEKSTPEAEQHTEPTVVTQAIDWNQVKQLLTKQFN